MNATEEYLIDAFQDQGLVTAETLAEENERLKAEVPALLALPQIAIQLDV